MRYPTVTDVPMMSANTFQWFLDNTKDCYSGEEFHDIALFYSRGMTSAARSLAEGLAKVTIWDVWPCYLYESEQADSNPMRCIHQDREIQQDFFKNMSLAFAKMARHGATVLHSSEHYDAPPSDGIWASTELPELQRTSGPVHWLRKIRMHPQWSGNPLSSSGLSNYDNIWLKSRDAIEWLSRLKTDLRRDRTYLTEIFWERSTTHQRLGNNELKRRAIPLKLDRNCLSEEKLKVFDNVVNW
jgi:hypothetical protein